MLKDNINLSGAVYDRCSLSLVCVAFCSSHPCFRGECGPGGLGVGYIRFLDNNTRRHIHTFISNPTTIPNQMTVTSSHHHFPCRSLVSTQARTPRLQRVSSSLLSLQFLPQLQIIQITRPNFLVVGIYIYVVQPSPRQSFVTAYIYIC